MKMVLLAAVALVAAPAFAQTTSPQTVPSTTATPDQSTMAPPATTAPMTPPAAPADPSMASPAPTTATPTTAPMTTDSAAPAPMASTGKLPWCRKGQYNGCREHENAKGEGVSKN